MSRTGDVGSAKRQSPSHSTRLMDGEVSYWISTLHWPSSVVFCEYGKFLGDGVDVVAIGTCRQVYFYRFGGGSDTQLIKTFNVKEGHSVNNGTRVRIKGTESDALFLVTGRGVPMMVVNDGWRFRTILPGDSTIRRYWSESNQKDPAHIVVHKAGNIVVVGNRHGPLYILSRDDHVLKLDGKRLKDITLETVYPYVAQLSFPTFSAYPCSRGDVIRSVGLVDADELPVLMVHRTKGDSEVLEFYTFDYRSKRFFVSGIDNLSNKREDTGKTAWGFAGMDGGFSQGFLLYITKDKYLFSHHRILKTEKKLFKDQVALCKDGSNVEYMAYSDCSKLESNQMVRIMPRNVIGRVVKQTYEADPENGIEFLCCLIDTNSMDEYSEIQDDFPIIYTTPKSENAELNHGVEVMTNGSLLGKQATNDSPGEVSSIVKVSETMFLASTVDHRLLRITVEGYDVVYHCMGEFPTCAFFKILSEGYVLARTLDNSLIIFKLCSKEGDGWTFDILGQMGNLAPIVDGGLSSIDGDVRKGSLKLITRDIHLDSVVSFFRGHKPTSMIAEIEGLIDNIWLLYKPNSTSMLLISTTNGGMMVFSLSMATGDIHQLEDVPWIDSETKTILMSQISEDLAVQVTENAICYINIKSKKDQNWKIINRQVFGEKIHFAVAPSDNCKRAVCSVGRSRLVSLNEALEPLVTRDFDIDIAGLAADENGDYVVASFWDSTVHLLDGNTLATMDIKTVENGLARSLLFTEPRTLLVGAADGALLTHKIEDNRFCHIRKKSIGNKPVQLQHLILNSKEFLCSSDSCFVVDTQGNVVSRLLTDYARPISLPQARQDKECLLALCHDRFVEIVLLDTDCDTVIGEHQKFSDYKSQVHGVSMVAEFHLVALLEAREGTVTEKGGTQLAVTLLDEYTGQIAKQHVSATIGEEPLCIEYVYLDGTHYLVVGTQRLNAKGTAYDEGYLHLFCLYKDSEGRVEMVHVDGMNVPAVPGCLVSSPDVPEADFLVGLGSIVFPMKLEPFQPTEDFGRFVRSKFPNNGSAVNSTGPIMCIHTFSNTIAIADALGGIRIYNISQNPKTTSKPQVGHIQEWPTAISLLNESHCIVSTMNGNLYTLEVNSSNSTQKQHLLCQSGSYQTGEIITKIINLDSTKAYLLGKEGGIYLFGVEPDYPEILTHEAFR